MRAQHCRSSTNENAGYTSLVHSRLQAADVEGVLAGVGLGLLHPGPGLALVGYQAVEGNVPVGPEHRTGRN